MIRNDRQNQQQQKDDQIMQTYHNLTCDEAMPHLVAWDVAEACGVSHDQVMRMIDAEERIIHKNMNRNR